MRPLLALALTGVLGTSLACGPDVVLGEHLTEAATGTESTARPHAPPPRDPREPYNEAPSIAFPRFDEPPPRRQDDLPLRPVPPAEESPGVPDDPSGPESASGDDFRPGDAGLEAEREVSGPGFDEFAQGGVAGAPDE
jgi:hypothetical protein